MKGCSAWWLPDTPEVGIYMIVEDGVANAAPNLLVLYIVCCLSSPFLPFVCVFCADLRYTLISDSNG